MNGHKHVVVKVCLLYSLSLGSHMIGGPTQRSGCLVLVFLEGQRNHRKFQSLDKTLTTYLEGQQALRKFNLFRYN